MTTEDAEHVRRTLHGVLDPERVVGVETGTCPHTAVREDPTANLAAIDGKIERPTMNVCTGVPATTKQLADLLLRELGGNVEVKDGPRRAGDLERSVLDPTYCQSVIGKMTAIDEGLTATARWFASRG